MEWKQAGRLARSAVRAGLGALALFAAGDGRATEVDIRGDDFLIDGKPTLEGRTWRGHDLEGLLPNARLVQGIFDDLNPETAARWAYPDTGAWDADRNTREFVAAMKSWREHGLLAFTLNLQGGSPEGYSREQPWHNSAFRPDGTLRPAYLKRLESVLREADRLGMVVILGYFYFGQDQRLEDEAAVVAAVDAATDWIVEKGFRHVLVELNNECDIRYDHPILRPGRVPELIRRVRERATAAGSPLKVSTSFSGGKVPAAGVIAASDFVLLHGNGVRTPDGIREQVASVRKVDTYKGQPIVFNEDDHFDFDRDDHHFLAATGAGASWGYFDFRMKDQGFEQGFQSVPVDWTIGSDRKRGFFRLLAEMSGTER